MFEFDKRDDRPQRSAPGAGAGFSVPDATTVLDLVMRVWAVRYWAIAGGVVFCVLAVLYAAVATPRFEAGAQVYIDPKDLQLFQNELAPNMSSGDSGTVIIESQARIMQSAAVLRDVVETLSLDEDPEFVGTPSPFSVAGLRAMLKGPGGPTDDVSIAAEGLAQQVHVVRADQTYVVEIYAEADDPETAAAIANTLVGSYLSLREDRRSTQVEGASTALEARLADLFTDLETAENAVERFRVENDLVDANGNLLVEDRLAQANRDVSTAEAGVLAARAQAEQLRGARGNPDRFLSSEAAVNSPDLLRLRGEIERVEAELGTLAATLGERHPRRVQAASRLASLRRSLALEITRLDRSASLALERAERQLAEARAALGRLTGESQTSDSALLTLRQLERESEAKRAVYERALLRARETREQQNLNTVNAQLVSPATAPLRKSSPPGLSKLLPAAGILGGLLGGALGLAVGWIRPAVGQRPRAESRAPSRFRRPRRAPAADELHGEGDRDARLGDRYDERAVGAASRQARREAPAKRSRSLGPAAPKRPLARKGPPHAARPPRETREPLPERPPRAGPPHRTTKRPVAFSKGPRRQDRDAHHDREPYRDARRDRETHPDAHHNRETHPEAHRNRETHRPAHHDREFRPGARRPAPDPAPSSLRAALTRAPRVTTRFAYGDEARDAVRPRAPKRPPTRPDGPSASKPADTSAAKPADPFASTSVGLRDRAMAVLSDDEPQAPRRSGSSSGSEEAREAIARAASRFGPLPEAWTERRPRHRPRDGDPARDRTRARDAG